MLALVVAGLVYQQVATVVSKPGLPAGGRLVDVGGHRLFLQVSGTPSADPTVVFDSGLGTPSSSADWSRVAPAIAERTRVVTYDRAGYGFSDDTKVPRTTERLAEELHTLLHVANVPAPYVLVGHSLGGFDVRMFAAKFPAEVAGAVLVDAAQEDGPADPSSGPTNAILRKIGVVRALATSGHLGQLTDAPHRYLASDQADLINEFAYARLDDAAQRDERENAGSATNLAAVRSTRDVGFGDHPLVVLTSNDNIRAVSQWAALQQSQLRLSTRSKQVEVESGHYIQWQQPGAVVDAVQAVLNGQVR